MNTYRDVQIRAEANRIAKKIAGVLRAKEPELPCDWHVEVLKKDGKAIMKVAKHIVKLRERCINDYTS